MQIYIDADSCPRQIRNICSKAALRTETIICFVSNRSVSIEDHPFISKHLVDNTKDAADQFILDKVRSHDIVITRDILLAQKLLDKEAVVINPLGELFQKETIQKRVDERNLMAVVRDSPDFNSATKQFNKKDVQRFSSAFDRELTKLKKK